MRKSKIISFTVFFVTAFFGGASEFSFGGEDDRGFTFRAKFSVGLVPKGEIAIRIAVASIEVAALL